MPEPRLAQVRVFLDSYAQTGQKLKSLEIAGISWEMHYHKLRNDPVYRIAVEKAEEQAGDMLEDLAVQRGLIKRPRQ